jgi:hypothetical protein
MVVSANNVVRSCGLSSGFGEFGPLTAVRDFRFVVQNLAYTCSAQGVG